MAARIIRCCSSSTIDTTARFPVTTFRAWRCVKTRLSISSFGTIATSTSTSHLLRKFAILPLTQQALNGKSHLYAFTDSGARRIVEYQRHCSTHSSGASKLGDINCDKMQIVFTCNVCQERSSRIISKHAYTKGVIIIRCYGCNNNHLIADNLGWFFDGPKNIEDIIAEKGGKVVKISGTELEFVPSEIDRDESTTGACKDV